MFRRRRSAPASHGPVDLDCLQLRVIPRTRGALGVVIDVYESQGGVNVWMGDYLPIELTAPINIEHETPRPFLDVMREVLGDAAVGGVDGELTASPWS